MAAASAGRHVLVEKAIAHTVAAADELIEACRARGVTLAGIFQNRFTPAARRLRETVASGALGRVFLASVTVKEHRAPSYFLDSPWRGRKAEAGGGVLMIQAIHMIDLLLWVLGMPRRVVAQTHTAVHDVEVEDVAVGLLEFEGGVVAALQATTAARAGPSRPRSRSTGIGDGHGQRQLGPSRLPAADGHRSVRPTLAELHPTRPAIEPYAEQIADFVAAVWQGRPPRSTAWRPARRSWSRTRCIARPGPASGSRSTPSRRHTRGERGRGPGP